MRGMILAGGLSTRLYPLTLKLPKPLVPVLDRPVVAHVLDYLQRSGVDDIAINVHYFSDAVRQFVGDGSRWGAKVTYLHETELMGSAGAVKQLAARFTETFVVISGDSLTDIDLAAATRFHRERRAIATTVKRDAEGHQVLPSGLSAYSFTPRRSTPPSSSRRSSSPEASGIRR